MNDLVTSTGYPPNELRDEPFVLASDYFTALAKQHMSHFQTQRNLATSKTDAQWRFAARHFFAQLVPKYSVDGDDAGPFRLFCDDLQPANMLADPETLDPETLRITAVLDLEFTNAMPAQLAYDLPW